MIQKIFAQSLTFPGGSISGPSGFKFGSIGNILSASIPYIFGIAGMGLLLMILSAGFTILTSAGDAKALEGGKQRLTNAIIGFLIIFVAFWMVQIAGKILGFTEISTVFN